MNIFGNTSTGFSKEIEVQCLLLRVLLRNLKLPLRKQQRLKLKSRKKSKSWIECTALDGVSTKANNLASKLEALFE